MSDVNAVFCSNFGEMAYWTIVDVGYSTSAPQKVFEGVLQPGECIGPLALYSTSGQVGRARWGRSDGPIQEDDVVDGARVGMI